MSGCSCKCHCGRKFDKTSGYLLNLSDKALKKLSNCKKFKEIKELYFDGEKQKHFVLCSDCIESLMGPIRVQDLKFKKNRWLTSNIAWYLRKKGWLTEKSLEWLTAQDDKGVLPYDKEQFNVIIKIIRGL